MHDDIILRPARADDAEALLAIYAPYVLNTAITYEYDVPTKDEFRARIENTKITYPYIVAERAGEPIAYAYTGRFHPRAAYDWDVEASIYIKDGFKGQGLGRRLYAALEAISRAQNMINLYACIAYPNYDDEYLTQNSVRFHEHIGFSPVGLFNNCAFKFGRWYNMVWMAKTLSEHTLYPKTVIPFSELPQALIDDILGQ